MPDVPHRPLPEVEGVTHSWATARGVRFHVAQAGTGDDVVVLLHGYPQHWYIPSACTTYTLSFYLYIDTAETITITPYDQLTVKLGRDQAGRLLQPRPRGRVSGYSLKSSTVGGFTGQTVTAVPGVV